MKPILLLPFCLLLFANCEKTNSEAAAPSVPTDYDQMQIKQYIESQANILNPERGFYTHRGFSASKNETLWASDIQKYREEGISLVFSIYYLKEFRDKPISEAFLELIRHNMRVLREGGNKAIVRFAYTSSREERPWDAPWEITPKDTLSLSTAFKGTPLARIAAHNDCFLADKDDRGTFANNLTYRNYWEAESKYTAMGGETCALSSLATCSHALAQFSQYHWSYLNRDYHQDVFKQWKGGKCLNEIQKRLGYRFSLMKGYFTKNPKIGSPYQIELLLKNTGWASPFNPRRVELLFISEEKPNEKYRITLADDPRYWFAGKTNTLKTTFLLPRGMSKGKYTIFLNLPDPREPLSKRKEYSIQLANKDTWNPQKGYNKIQEVTLSEIGENNLKSIPSLEKFTE
ncbi:DUF4832 domain-containing protein [Capnocytophaga granulosa]|uniref:DUF4832 domain-containing protein n=1 Tax=Capnocytophaga granulosa TaxID=45242 RepID=UPI0038572E2D